MTQTTLTCALGIAALSVAGCANARATWQQLLVATREPQAQDEKSVLAYYPQIGFVRGTRTVLARLGIPLEPAPGPNRTVEACREAVWREAAKLGARDIEAVSAGPERRNEKGQFVGPVRLRITYYKLLGGYEVREATLTCIVDPEGKFVSTEP
jgi:hypothetical protein